MAGLKRFPDRDEIAAVRAECEPIENGAQLAEERRLAGRAMARREMGMLVFLDLVDRSGRIQLLCDTGRIGEVDVHLGDVIGVVGKPAKSRRGEPSLAVDELVVLSRNESPLPDTFHGLTDVETRYRKRYLDLLMNEETRSDLQLRSRIVSAIRRYLDAEGFVEVETPILQPRYGGAFALPFVTHSGELDADLYLRIATELYLKRLIVGGLERVYEIGKDFRNESISYKHQPEFTMLEWYEAYADYRDTMARIEALLEAVALDVLGTTRVTFRGQELDLKAPWRTSSSGRATSTSSVRGSRSAGSTRVPTRTGRNSWTTRSATSSSPISSSRRSSTTTRSSCRRSRARRTTIRRSRNGSSTSRAGWSSGTRSPRSIRRRSSRRGSTCSPSTSSASEAIPTTSRLSRTACPRQVASGSASTVSQCC